MRRLLWSLLSVVLVILALITLLLTTPTGLRLTIRAVNSLTDVKIATQKLSGSILGTIAAQSIIIHTKDSRWQVTDLHLRFNPLPLLHSAIAVHSIEAASITGTIKESSGEKASGSSLPLISIKRAYIQTVSINTGGKAGTLQARDINWQGMLSSSTIHASLSVGFVKNVWDSATFRIKGPIDHYTFQGLIKTSYTQISASGSGNAHSVQSQIGSPKQRVQGDISVSWANGWQWSTTLQGHQLNLQSLLPDSPIIDSFEATNTGHYLQKLDTISWKVHAKTQAGEISTSGTHTQKATHASWDLKKVNLAHFYVGATGTISSAGTWKAGQTKGTLVLTKLHWKDWFVRHLDTTWNGNPLKQTLSHLSLAFKKLRYQTYSLRSGQLKASAPQNTINYSLLIKFDPKKTPLRKLTLTGNVTKQAVGNQVVFKTMQLKALGKNWSLKNPAKLSMTATTWSQSKLCLRNSSSSICLHGSGQEGDWSGKLLTKKLPLEMFLLSSISEFGTARIPADISIDLNQHHEEPLLASVALSIPHSHLSFHKTGLSSRVGFRNTILTAQLQSDKLVFASKNQWGKTDSWSVNGTIQRPSATKPDWLAQSITSTIALHSKNIAFINTFSDTLDIRSGQIDTNMQLTGTLDSPHMSGQVRLSNGSVKILPINNMLSDIQGTIQARGQTLTLDLQGKTPTAPFTIHGTTHYLKNFSDWNTKLTVKATNALFVNTPNYMVTASPNLDITLNNEQVDLSGKINIDEATIRPNAMSSAETLPSDVIILNKEAPRDQHLSLNVAVNLGDKVWLKNEAIKARLVGDITLKKKVDQPILADGAIGIKKGTIKKFGLDLLVDPTSTVSYQNSPIGKPSLDVKIYRKIKAGGFGSSVMSGDTDLTVGVSARGPYQNLIVTMYSSPVQLSQADILSYLLFGHQSNASSALNIASLLAVVGSISSDNMGSGMSKILSIQKTLGFTELGMQSSLSLDALGTPYGLDETGFVVGRYLTPRIYLRYIRGTSILMNLFQAQYLINKNWSLQVQSGNTENIQAQGADMLYHFSTLDDESSVKK